MTYQHRTRPLGPIQLAGLTALVMAAFAANSLLNRAALGADLIDSLSFALVRVISGAVVLMALTRARVTRRNIAPAAALSLYLVALSLAYVSIDAGVGALILFAVVQITMMVGAYWRGDALPPIKLIGGAVALSGLALLLLPSTQAVPGLWPSLIMAASGFGWGLYSLYGQNSADPLKATAANFLLAVPMVAVCVVPFGLQDMTWAGIGLATASGALSSALGYALWYAILPQLGAVRASVVQLSVPVVVLIGGLVFLGETLSTGAALASLVTLLGVALASVRFRRG